MSPLQNKLQQIGAALSAAIGTNVHHYFRPTGEVPSCVWQEDREDNSFHTGNHKTEQAITGTVDYFTQTEFDTTLDTVQQTLEDIGAAWRIESVQYEESTKLIHYEWRWTVRTDREIPAPEPTPEEPEPGEDDDDGNH